MSAPPARLTLFVARDSCVQLGVNGVWMWFLWLRQGQRSGGAGSRYNNFVRASVVPAPEIPAGNDILAYKAAGLPPGRSASRRGLGSYWPTAPSIRWRSRSTWPLCRAHSSTMCTGDAIPPAVRGGSGPVELASRRIHQWRAVPQHATIHQRNQHAHDHLTINGATTQRLCRAAVVRELVTEGGGGPAVANSQRRSLCASFPDQAIPVVLTGRWLRRPPPGSRRLLPFGGQLYSLLVTTGRR